MPQIDLSAAGDAATLRQFESLEKSGIVPAPGSMDARRRDAATERQRERLNGRDPAHAAKAQVERGSSSDLHNRTAAEAVRRGDRGWTAADALARLVEVTVTGAPTHMGGATPDHDPRVAGGLAGSYDDPKTHYRAEALSQVLGDRAARAMTTAKSSLAVDLFKLREDAATDPSYAEAVEYAERKAKKKGHRRDLIRDFNRKLTKLQTKRAKSETLAKSHAPTFRKDWGGRSVLDVRDEIRGAR